MGLTREQRAERERLKQIVENNEALAALRPTPGEYAPDLPAPDRGGAYIEGWDYWPEGPPRVFYRWSTCGAHGNENSRMTDRATGGGRQGGRDLYSTKERALRAMRRELELRFGRALLAIDKQIAEEVK
jgi:hypothetical protein